MKMVLGRSFVLATTKGHAIRFEKNKPTHVPDICVHDAVAIGALPADGTSVDVIGEEPKREEGPSNPLDREKEILSAIEAIVVRNSRTDFTAAGLPSTDALRRVLGYDVGSSERSVIWQTYCNNKAAAADDADVKAA